MEKTLSQLRTEARQRADMVQDSGAVSDAEANLYVNAAYHELYDIITVADEARLFTVNATNPPPQGNAFQLPSDFYRLVSVSILHSGSYIPAKPADPSRYAELAAATDAFPNSYGYRYYVRWNINTSERLITIFPVPDPGSVAITYWPQPKELSLDSDSLDNPASWLEFVTVSAAIRMLDKVERDATALLLAKRQLAKRITQAVYSTDLSYPRVLGEDTGTGFGGYSW